MASQKGRAGIPDGHVVATIRDQFDEPRDIVQRGSRIRVASNTATPNIAMNRELARIVGEKIRAARLEKGLTLEECAIRAGMVSGWPKARMYEIESGPRRSGVKMGTLYAIAAALGMEATAFMPTVAEVMALANVEKVGASIVTLNGSGKVLEVV